MKELIEQSATQCVALLKRGEIHSRDLVNASISRIEQVDPQINALPIHCFERALAQAEQVSPDTVLSGLPIAVKDYNDIGGVRTTYGSPIFANYTPAESDNTVAHLERNGAIPVAKSNVPEWAGGNTVNSVLGQTRNPWNLSLTAGGSSGGSAAALASGQVWLATGNDLGGSLRTPSSFNGIVGLRPGPGRVPRGVRLQAFDSLWVEGPMARSVTDVALMLDASAGFAASDPLSFSSIPGEFSAAVTQPKPLSRVAFSADLGQVPMSQEIANVCEVAAKQCGSLGAEITNDIPDFSGAAQGFQTLRAVLIATMMSELYEKHRDAISADIVGNIERGIKLTPHEIFDAHQVRWRLHQEICRFFENHDVMICPAVSVEPFPVDQNYVTSIDGKELDTYIDWFAITFILSMSACPVLTLPCGFTQSGLPVGLQLMGKPRGEAELLSVAAQLESLVNSGQQVPINPRPAS